jgi:WD40 repeat protein
MLQMSPSAKSIDLPHGNMVWRAIFHPHQTTLVTCSRGVRLWDLATAQPVAEWRGATHGIGCAAVAIHPRDFTLTLVERDKTIRFYDSVTGAEVAGPIRTQSRVNCLAYSPDGRWLVAGCANRKAYVWGHEAHELAADPLVHQNEIYGVRFAPDGAKCAVQCKGMTAQLWAPGPWTPTGGPLQHRLRVGSTSWSPDSTVLVTSSDDMHLYFWDAHTSEPRHMPVNVAAWIWTTSYSPDGQFVLVGTEATAGVDRGKAELYESGSGRWRASVTSHQQAVIVARFSPDGKSVLSASPDMRVKLAAVETPAAAPVELPHAAAVYDALFSPDGQKIASCCADGYVRLWSVRDLVSSG